MSQQPSRGSQGKTSESGQREKDAAIRRQQRNAPWYDETQRTLEQALANTGMPFTKENLLTLARDIASVTKTKLDRDAQRRMSSLICWFCENMNRNQPATHFPVDIDWEDDGWCQIFDPDFL